VIAEAAALWESLSQNHPFLDGNKRTAFASMAAHLAINGYWLHAEELEAYRFVMDLYESQRFRMSELDAWWPQGTLTGPQPPLVGY
jgi:death-on-curing protein